MSELLHTFLCHTLTLAFCVEEGATGAPHCPHQSLYHNTASPCAFSLRIYNSILHDIEIWLLCQNYSSYQNNKQLKSTV